MSSLFDLYLTPQIAKPVAMTAIFVVLVFCVRWRKGSAGLQPSFLCRLALVLAVAVMALPLLPPFNQILLLPGLLVVLHMWNELWHRGRMVRVVCGVGTAIMLLCWLVAGVLAVVDAISPGVSRSGIWEAPFILSFAVPPVVAGLLIVLLKDVAPHGREGAPLRSGVS
jgi:hypothetical protein